MYQVESDFLTGAKRIAIWLCSTNSNSHPIPPFPARLFLRVPRQIGHILRCGLGSGHSKMALVYLGNLWFYLLEELLYTYQS